jgi:hypothetical protein
LDRCASSKPKRVHRAVARGADQRDPVRVVDLELAVRAVERIFGRRVGRNGRIRPKSECDFDRLRGAMCARGETIHG